MSNEPFTSGGFPPSRSPVDRAKAILLQPAAEWPVIDAEPATIAGIYKAYVIPLAAIGPVSTLIGGLVFGYGILGIHYRPSATSAIGQAVVSYVLGLASVYILALVIDALAPSFGGIKSPIAAFKVAAYSATASWLAGIFGIWPPIAVLGLLGLYSLYLLYLGLPRLMRVPEAKALGYTVVVVIVAVVITFVVGAIATAATHVFAPVPTLTTADGTLTIPGMGTIDTAKLDHAASQMNAAVAQAQAATANPSTTPGAQTGAALAPDALQALLPASLPSGFARTDLSSGSGGVGAIGGSNATATYTAGGAHIELSLTDMAAMGALAGLGGALNLQSSHQTATGYEKTGVVDGRMTTEKWDSSDHDGTFSTIVGNRFMVEANGNPGSIDALKGAVAAVDPGKLTALTAR